MQSYLVKTQKQEIGGNLNYLENHIIYNDFQSN